MSLSRTHRAAALSITLVVSGCGASGEPSDPHDKLAAVKDALGAPSGKVDATSMRSVSKLYETMTDAGPVFSAIGVIDSEKAKACLSGSGSSGAYDLACATSGEVTGKLSFQADGTVSQGATQATYIVTYDQACAGTTCVSGSVIVEAKVAQGSVETTVAFSADVTKGGQKSHLFFGEQASVSNGSATAKVVLFDGSEQSYVIESAVGAAGVSYSVQGSNGAYQCSLGASGGQCSGAASFTY